MLNQDGWLASAALDNARYFSGSLLVAQATMDESVHLENTMTLLDELLDRGKYPETLIFPDRRDLFSDPKARAVMFQRLTDFFLKNL
jgi:dipeptidyl aminopeptidase/acylaminoacyl peptidase